MLRDSMKICLIGDLSVGKTCIVSRLVKNHFNDEEKATVAASFMTTSLTYDDKTYDISIWDTAGQEKYRSMVGMYYRGSSGAIIVYDITSDASFKHVETWCKDLRDAVPDVAIALVGNKMDQTELRKVDTTDGAALADDLKINVFMECSALSGENVKLVFGELLKRMKPKERCEKNFVEHHQIGEVSVEQHPCC
ncbi:Rab family GTPase [Entamoeba marina]